MSYPVDYVEGSGLYQSEYKRCPHSVMIPLHCSICKCGYVAPSRKSAPIASVVSLEDETEVEVSEEG